MQVGNMFPVEHNSGVSPLGQLDAENMLIFWGEQGWVLGPGLHHDKDFLKVELAKLTNLATIKHATSRSIFESVNFARTTAEVRVEVALLCAEFNRKKQARQMALGIRPNLILPSQVKDDKILTKPIWGFSPMQPKNKTFMDQQLNDGIKKILISNIK